jgi:hypothetical protein
MLRSACDYWLRMVPCVSLHHASANGVLLFCFELTALVFTLLLVLRHARSLRWNDSLHLRIPPCAFAPYGVLQYHVNREELIATLPSCADDCVPSTRMIVSWNGTELSLATASLGQRTVLPSSCRRVHATSGGIRTLGVTLISSAANCIRRKRSYTAPVTHTLCTYQKLECP